MQYNKIRHIWLQAKRKIEFVIGHFVVVTIPASQAEDRHANKGKGIKNWQIFGPIPNKG